MRTFAGVLAGLLFVLPALAQPTPTYGPAPYLNLSPIRGDTTTTCGGIATCAAQTGTNQQNTGFGYNVLNAQTSTASTGFGYNALVINTGHANTAIGGGAGATITSGTDLIAIGNDAMLNNDGSGNATGADNIALGVHSLSHLTSASFNVAVGNEAMVGCGNWVGFPACVITGDKNTAIGQYAMQNVNGAPSENVAVGYAAGEGLTTGTQNVLLGSFAGDNLTIGTQNIMIGRDILGSGATVSNELNIGNLIRGTGVTQGGDATSGTVTIYGTARVGGASGPIVLGQSGTTFTYENSNAGVIAQMTTSSSTGGTATYPVLQANGGTSPAQLYVQGGGTGLQLGLSGTTVTVTGGLEAGTGALTIADSAIGMTKRTASAAAPGAAGGRLELVCGTNAGTAKLIIYAGTSTTPVTVTDNVGTGVTGC